MLCRVEPMILSVFDVSEETELVFCEITLIIPHPFLSVRLPDLVLPPPSLSPGGQFIHKSQILTLTLICDPEIKASHLLYSLGLPINRGSTGPLTSYHQEP